MRSEPAHKHCIENKCKDSMKDASECDDNGSGVRWLSRLIQGRKEGRRARKEEQKQEQSVKPVNAPSLPWPHCIVHVMGTYIKKKHAQITPICKIPNRAAKHARPLISLQHPMSS